MSSSTTATIPGLLGAAPVLGDALEEIQLVFGPGTAPAADAKGKHAFHTFTGQGLLLLAAFSAGHAYNLALLRQDGAAFSDEETETWILRNAAGVDGWTESAPAAGHPRRWVSCDPHAVIELSADRRQLTASARRAVDPVPRGLSSWDRAGHFHLRLPWKAPRPEV